LPPEKFAQKKQGEGSKDLPTEPKKLQLNSAEELYAEIRDKNFNAVGAALSKKAKIISAAFEVRRTVLVPSTTSWEGGGGFRVSLFVPWHRVRLCTVCPTRIGESRFSASAPENAATSSTRQTTCFLAMKN